MTILYDTMNIVRLHKQGESVMNKDYDFTVTNVGFAINRKCTMEWRLINPTLGHYVVVYIVSGGGEFLLDGEGLRGETNDVFLFPPGTPRTSKFDEGNPWHFISISFDVCRPDGSPYSFDGVIPMVTHNVNAHLLSAFKKVDKNWSNKSKLYMTICRTAVQDILCQLFSINDAVSHNPTHYAKIEAAKQYINNNYMRSVSVEELANYVELSPSHFRKVFREIVGVSATQYAIYLRINKAKDLLISGSANVSEAAFQAGFKDIYYFSAMFKKVTGENPSKYLR